MPKDFDEQRRLRAEEDREFIVRGETFVRRVGVRPEIIAEWEEVQTLAPAEMLKAIDGIVLSLVVPDDDAAARWERVRALAGDDAITLVDMQQIVEWLIEAQTERRPTRPSSPS